MQAQKRSLCLPYGIYSHELLQQLKGRHLCAHVVLTRCTVPSQLYVSPMTSYNDATPLNNLTPYHRATLPLHSKYSAREINHVILSRPLLWHIRLRTDIARRRCHLISLKHLKTHLPTHLSRHCNDVLALYYHAKWY